MKENRYNSEIKQLAQAKDYIELLNIALNCIEQERGRGAKAYITSKAGFASRSFLTEVLSGKKGLSRDSVVRLKQALKLNSELGKLFELLVAKKYPDVVIQQLTKSELEHKIFKARKLAATSLQSNNHVALPHLSNPEVFQVYAALGSEELGASLEEITARTGLKEKNLKPLLSSLMATNAVRTANNRFYAVTSKADSLNTKDTKAIAQMVEKVCSHLQKNSLTVSAEQGNLNLYTAFSVRRENILKLKQDLQKAIMTVLDEYQDDNGDSVEQVFVNLFRNSVS